MDNLSNPEILERIYRGNRKGFREAFNEVYPEISDTETIKFWKVRLEYDFRSGSPKTFELPELIKVITVCLITAFLIKIPALFNTGYSDEVFYMKNTGIIVFFGLALYYVWNSRFFHTFRLAMTTLTFLIPALYINLLPSQDTGDAVNLVYIHLPLLMWFIYGVVFTGYEFRNLNRRMDFIRYNGDLAIMYALIALAGGLLTGITVGLFDSIGLNIEEFYAKNIIITGAAAAPVVATFITDKFPALVSRIAPLIATIFSPLVLLTLVIFLITIIVTGKDPYNDRDFLLVFNIMLSGVMGVIIFSVSGTSAVKHQRFNGVVLFMLAIITIIIDLIALSAIFYRLEEFGLTPNRLAVLISNVLVLGNLILIMADLFRINFKNREFRALEMTVAKYLPVYLVWIIIVVFGFPFIFGMN